MILLIILCSLLVGCNDQKRTLTIGMIPVRDKENMIENFEPIRQYLEDQLKVPVNVIVTKDYASLVNDMKNKTIDIGWYGAFSYIAAESQLQLTPLVVQDRVGIGVYYQSMIITHSDSKIHSIDDLENSTFTFVDSGSTSGYVLPYALFKSRDLDYEQFFEHVLYSGSHHQVAFDIKNRVADAGAISSTQFNRLVKDGVIDEKDYRVIWKSDDIPSSPFVARSDVDEEIQKKFTSALVNIHLVQPEALEKFDDSIQKYVEVDKNIYHSIRNIATILGKDYMVKYFLKSE